MNQTTLTLGKGAKSILPQDNQQLDIITADQALYIKELADVEAFMNEVVEIRLHETATEGEPDHVVLQCNGINHVVFRGVPTQIKRKYVEVLARMRETKYVQVRDPIQLDKAELKARVGNVFPFEVTADQNPKGTAWIRAIQAERDV